MARARQAAVGALALLAWGASPAALARVSLTGGYTQLSGSAQTGFSKTAPTFGLEAVEATSPFFEPGMFVQGTLGSRNDGTSAGIAFIGAMARVQVPKAWGLFLEARVGGTAGLGAAGSDVAPGYGAAAGFRFRIGTKVMVGPRVSFDRLTAEHGTTPSPFWDAMNLGLVLTFGQTKK